MLTFMWTCDTCACYVTSWVGWGGGDVNVHVNLRHTRHEACNHSKGIFCIKKRIKNKRILIHTGGVDAMWRLSKSAIPCSLATRVNGHVNPKLMRSIRIWQWRWQSSKENVLEKTGRMLQKRMESWKRKKNRRVFSTKIPVNYRQTCLNHLIFPGKIQWFLRWRSIVSLWRKRHFSKTLKTLARFSPRRDVFVSTWDWSNDSFDCFDLQHAFRAFQIQGHYALRHIYIYIHCQHVHIQTCILYLAQCLVVPPFPSPLWWWSLYVFGFIQEYASMCVSMCMYTGWWFGTCSIFPYIGNNHPNWLIFFRGVQTTNQYRWWFVYVYASVPVVPHKAVAEVSE